MKSRRMKVIVVVLSTGVAAFAAIGLLHMPFGRQLLQSIGGCPVGKATPAQLEEARMGAVRGMRGKDIPPARPAVGFILDSTTHDQVVAWADSHKFECESKNHDALLMCTGVAPSSLGEPEGVPVELNLGFNVAAKLVNITVMHRSLDPNSAEHVLGGVVDRLATDLGKPDVVAGERSGAYLSSGPLQTAVVEYKFSDYIAEVSATNFSKDGISVREHYLSARD